MTSPFSKQPMLNVPCRRRKNPPPPPPLQSQIFLHHGRLMKKEHTGTGARFWKLLQLMELVAHGEKRGPPSWRRKKQSTNS